MSNTSNLVLPDDGDFSRVRTSAQGPEYAVGTMRETIAGKRYRYVKFLDAVTYVQYHVVTWANAACTSVTNDISGGSSLGAAVAGTVQGNVPAQNGFGWIQTWGPGTAKTSGADDIAFGESLFVHGSTDGTCDGASAATYVTGNLGYALTVDDNDANTVTAMIQVW